MPVSFVTVRPLVDAAEAAVYTLAREGKIPHYRVGGSFRFDLDELRAWLEENRRGPKVGAP